MGGLSTSTTSSVSQIGLYSGIAGTVTNLFAGLSSASSYGAQADIYNTQAQVYLAQGQYESYLAEFNASQAEASAYLSQFNSEIYGIEAGLYGMIGDYNELIGESNALAYEIETLRTVMDIRRAASATEGQQVTGFAKAGVTAEGTPTVVLLDTISRAEQDVRAAMEDGERSAAIARSQGAMAGVQADIQATNALMQSASSNLQAELGFASADQLRESIKWIDYAAQAQAWSAQALATASEVKATASIFSSAGSLLTGVSNVALAYSKMPTINSTKQVY